MRYAVAKVEQNAKDTAYRIYITDTLRMLTENTAAFAGGHYMNRRFIELIAPAKEETRTEDEIIEQIRRRVEEVK